MMDDLEKAFTTLKPNKGECVDVNIVRSIFDIINKPCSFYI